MTLRKIIKVVGVLTSPTCFKKVSVKAYDKRSDEMTIGGLEAPANGSEQNLRAFREANHIRKQNEEQAQVAVQGGIISTKAAVARAEDSIEKPYSPERVVTMTGQYKVKFETTVLYRPATDNLGGTIEFYSNAQKLMRGTLFDALA